MTTGIAHHLENTLRRTFSLLVVDYLRDDAGEWWALQIKAFALSVSARAGGRVCVCVCVCACVCVCVL